MKANDLFLTEIINTDGVQAPHRYGTEMVYGRIGADMSLGIVSSNLIY